MYLGDNFIVGGITDFGQGLPVVRPEAQIMLTNVSRSPAVRRGRVEMPARSPDSWRSPVSQRAIWR